MILKHSLPKLAWQALGNRLWCLSAWRVSETLKDYASVSVCDVLESRCECPETHWGPSSLRRAALSLRQVSGGIRARKPPPRKVPPHTEHWLLSPLPAERATPPETRGHSLSPLSLHWLAVKEGLPGKECVTSSLRIATEVTLRPRGQRPESGGGK